MMDDSQLNGATDNGKFDSHLSQSENFPDNLHEDIVSNGEQTSSDSCTHDSWQQERSVCQQKIALLQSSILELESALSTAQARLCRYNPDSDCTVGELDADCPSLKQSDSSGPCMSRTREHPPCHCPRLELQSDHCRPSRRTAGYLDSSVECGEGGTSPSPPLSPASASQLRSSEYSCCHLRHSVSDSELSDYHSDCTDSRTPQPSDSRAEPPQSQASPSLQQLRGTRRLRSCSLCQRTSSPLQESGIFDVDVDDKAVQTDVFPSSSSMREFADLNSEIARLTSVQKQLQLQQQSQQHDEAPESPSSHGVQLPELCVNLENLSHPSSKKCDPISDKCGIISNSVSVQTDYCHDQLLCDYENLLKRFKKNKNTLNRIEEEKNELEEAENDARLMVQRLEMKIFASSEVEKMLSSDLAEEQERSCQLQRQLNSLKLKRQAEIKALHSDQDRVQLIQRVKQQENLVCILKDKLKKASKLFDCMDEKTVKSNLWIDWRDNSCSNSSSLSDKSDSSSLYSPTPNIPSKTSMESQTGLSVQMSQFCRISSRNSDDSAQNVELSRPTKRPRSVVSEGSDSTQSEFSGFESGDRCAECHRQLSSSSPSDSPTSDSQTAEQRETYYTECIQKLESERAASRKRWENEKADLLKTIEDANRGQSCYKQKLETALNECENIRKTLSDKVNELHDHLRERTQSFDELHQKTVSDSALQLETLSEQGAHLQQRVLVMEQLLGTVATEFSSRVTFSSNLDDFSTEVIDSVRSLKDNNKRMTAELGELQRKESAYKETLAKADSIMREVETRYQQTISDLEQRLSHSSEAVTFLEGRAADLQSRMECTTSADEQQNAADILVRLVETEKRVQYLEGELHEVDKRERDISIRLRQEELNCTNLQHQLQESDEVAKELQITRSYLSECAEQMNTLESVRQRLAEQQQNNDFMHGRVEELEQNEVHLQSTIQEMKTTHESRERNDQDKIVRLESEVDSLQLNYQNSQLQLSDNEDKLERLEKQLLDVQKKLSMAREDANNVKTSSSQAELQLRQELIKLRSQLSVTNQQLVDAETSSSLNREKILQLENDNSRLMAELRSQTSLAKQDVMKLNLEISRYEEQISALSEQLGTVQLCGEVDPPSDRGALLDRLTALAQHVQQQIKTCDSCDNRVGASFVSIVSDLDKLRLFLAGSDQDQSLHVQLRDALDRENPSSPALSVDPSECSEPAEVMTSAEPSSYACSTDLFSQHLQKQVDHAVVQTDSNNNDTCMSLDCRVELQRCLEDIKIQLEGKERELQLVDAQSSQLQSQLESRDQQVCHLQERLASSSEQLQLQRDQHLHLAEQLKQLQLSSQQLEARAAGGERLLSAVVRQLSLVLRLEQTEQLVALLQQQDEGEQELRILCRQLTTASLTRSSVNNTSALSTGRSCRVSVRSRIPRPTIRRSSMYSLPDSETVSNTHRKRYDSLMPSRQILSRIRQVPLVGVALPYRNDLSQSAVLTTNVKSSLPLPSPDQFQVIKKVGADSLLLYWSAASDPRITGYEIFVDNKLSQVIRNPGRTKALLPSLRLDSGIQLAIRSVSATASKVSALAWAEYTPRSSKH